MYIYTCMYMYTSTNLWSYNSTWHTSRDTVEEVLEFTIVHRGDSGY